MLSQTWALDSMADSLCGWGRLARPGRGRGPSPWIAMPRGITGTSGWARPPLLGGRAPVPIEPVRDAYGSVGDWFT